MKQIKLPLSEKDRLNLKAGDYLLLSGTILTARDAAHKRLVESIKNQEVLPFDLTKTAIYYVGPTPAKPNQPIGACGPTSSYRMDPFVPTLLEQGLKVMIGKGERSDQAKHEIQKHQALYLIVTGGIGALASKRVKSSKVILYEDLGAEAIYELVVEDFPAIVAYDTHGNDLYESKKN